MRGLEKKVLIASGCLALLACSHGKKFGDYRDHYPAREIASETKENFVARADEALPGMSNEDKGLLGDMFDGFKNTLSGHDHSKYLHCKIGGQERRLELYEQCDQDDEKARFEDLGKRIQKVQEENRKLHANAAKDGKHLFRGFHAKSHGCLHGELRVNDPRNRPEWTRKGIFAEAKNHLAWTRFSNGTGLIQGDYKAEPRGLAIKVVGVEGERASLYGNTFEKQTQDFLMTNKPFATTPDPVAFIEFAEWRAGLRAGTDFLPKNRWIVPILGELLKSEKQWIPNMAAITYWSGVPISMGKNEAGKMVPVKFFVEACENAPYLGDKEVMGEFGTLSRLAGKIGQSKHIDYGREWLKKLSSKYEVCYDVKFQIQKDVDTTSVEDGLDEWTVEESEPITVGQLILPKQNFDTDENNKRCERMRFNPWNSIAEHTPMSDTNQGRGIVYLRSAQKRESKDWTRRKAVEPTAKEHPLYKKE